MPSASIALLLFLFAMTGFALEVCESVPVYEPCEISLEMSAAELEVHPNPYVSVELRAEFRSPKKGTTYVIPAFWDGGGRLRIRFSPLDEGRWDFRLISNLDSVNKKMASFEATAPRTPGFVRVFNLRYFRYDQPETAHFWMGDTSYKFATIPWETFRGWSTNGRRRSSTICEGCCWGLMRMPRRFSRTRTGRHRSIFRKWTGGSHT